MRRVRFGVASVLAAVVAAGCALGPNTPKPAGKPRPSPSATRGGVLPSPGASLGPGSVAPGGTIVANNGSNVINQDPGGSIIANNGGNLIGKVKAPAQLISDKGLGFRVLSVSQAPVAGVTVSLETADGKAVYDETGKRISTTTDAEGNYRLPLGANPTNLVLKAELPGEKGDLVGLVAIEAGARERTVDLDLTSTLVMGYVLTQYVKGDPTVLNKLPAPVEQKTRQVMGEAVLRAPIAVPEALVAEEVVEVVDGLRRQDLAIDQQLEVVRKLLIAGLSDQGMGLSANEYETDALDAALGPDGTVYFAGLLTQRVWKKDAAGKLSPVAGNGLNLTGPVPAPDQPAPGDGQLATQVYCEPVAIEVLPSGRLLILENQLKRVRVVDTDGVIRTYAAHADFTDVRDLAVEPDGSVVVATHSALYRIKPDKTIALIAGEKRTFDATLNYSKKDAGDGGPPSAARFISLSAVTSDPATGALYVYDFNGKVRRLSADRVETVAGTGTPGFGGDGGPATSAQLNRIGGLLVRPDGTLVISDSMNRRIREVKDGGIRTVAGTGANGLEDGPLASASMLEPRLMALTPAGAILVVDGAFVRKLEGDRVSTVVGGTRHLGQKLPANQIQLLQPCGLTYDPARHAMLIGDVRHLFRWTLADDMLEAIVSKGQAGDSYDEGAPALAVALNYLRSPIIEPDGSVSFFSMAADDYVPRFSNLKEGRLATVAGGKIVQGAAFTDSPVLQASLYGPDTIYVRIGDTYYYTIRPVGRIRSFKAGGTTAAFAGGGKARTDGALAKDFDFKYVTTIARGPDGFLYVGELGGIWRIDLATSQVTHVAGAGDGYSGDGGPALDAKFDYPEAFVWDAAGRLYFSDSSNANIRRIDPATGVITTVAGAGTANLSGNTIDTGLAFPTGLAFDKDGHLYIADSRHGQIKVVPANRL